MRPRARLHPVWMMAPTAIFLAVFFIYPLLFAFYQSFFSWDLLTEPQFVGAQHYEKLLVTGALARTLTTTLVFSVVAVGGSMVLGLSLAVALDRPGAFAAFVRGAIFSAYVVSWVSVALLWALLLDADMGVVNAVLRAMGLPVANWLGDPDIAIYTLAGVTIWKIAGYSMVLFLAGLQDVPPRLREAAALDGARSWQIFRYITWPLLRPTAAFVGTTSLILTFQVFDIVRIMTQGGPVHSTTVFVYSIYEQIFLNLRVGRASAEVTIFFFLLLALTGLQLWAWRTRRTVKVIA